MKYRRYNVVTRTRRGGTIMTANADIKSTAKEKHVCLWEIAEALNIADTTMSRKLRRELSDADKAEIFAIIERVAAQHAAAVAN